MDLQRSLLIGAIAVLGFMLLTEWVAFSDERASTQQLETTRILNNDAAPGVDVPIAPAPGLDSAEDDIPDAPSLEQASDAGQNLPASVATADIVQIHTDSLQVAIDLNGGDIIELALPRHLADIDDPNSAFVLLEQNDSRIYVAQSGLIGQDGIDAKGRARFTTSSDRFEMVDGQDSLTVDLNWTNDNGVKVIKRFSFNRGDYLIKVDYLVENGSDARWQANLFGQIKRDSTVAPSASNSGMGMQPFLGAAITQPDERFTKFTFEDMEEEPFKAQLPGGWIAMLQHYFLSAWVPNQDQTHTYSTRVTNSGFNIAGFTSPALTLDPGQNGTVGASFWAGPKDQYRLKEISPYLDLVVDYGFLWWIAQPLFWLLTKMHALVGNWGGAIILLTLLVKAAFFKLSATSYKSMARMRKVQPKMLEIREMHADDKQKQSQAMMELYRKEKVNPMGGCLPILVQMPVFIALYWVLMESVELRQAPFALWINDLSVMDPYFVLPILMGGSMWFMQKLNPPPTDPMQAKIMQWLPIIFTFFFLWFPAGLVLYWVVNNLLSMAQQYVITKQIERGDIA
ncbi:membrane protein insertase YidC [Halioglobus maricola]|uniref:Membrane protein insertase YidC n=1 Tax=Halioglobus maricola TaxID=2601894 RepID=A0A5P9NQF5_9GAMM|nr:membrane protein insertase YidC [Halioglobus maricola]QFU77685.1 membrane protein insertase YidC [Halioglobus maricola]